ncbi:MAG: hypothetical protein AAB401_12790 [Acidobacteriota bacterium]
MASTESQSELLRQEILRGLEDIEQGRYSTYQTDAELDELADKIIWQGISKSVSMGYQEIADLLTLEPTSDQLLALKISASAQERLEELLDKNREEEIAPEERAELNSYLRLSEYLTGLKARIRAEQLPGRVKN